MALAKNGSVLMSRVALRIGRLLPIGLTERMRRLGQWLRRTATALKPEPQSWRHAAWGIVFVTAVILAVFAWPLVIAFPHPNWVGLLVFAGIILLAILGALATLLLVWIIAALPAGFRLALLAAIPIPLVLFTIFMNELGALLLVAAVMTSASLLGAGLGGIFTRRNTRASARRITAYGSAIIGGAFLLVVTWWLLDPGVPGETQPAFIVENATTLDAPDPSQTGEFDVLTRSYGSGKDRYRSEFSEEATFITQAVDGSKLLDGWEGLSGWARTRYWGFDDSELPVQGRVWYPEGEGPFPLIVAVHGNHLMAEYSDAGYAYLGEQFASRGYMFVSVDQNFLNTAFTNALGNDLREENDARAWLLLEHLRVLHEWNDQPEHAFFRKIDTDRIGLIGHSRGGEAVAIAAAFNRLPYYPDDATLAFDYGFNIRAVAAIAPVDGQYKPARTGTPLRDVSYFVIQGGYDSDMYSFVGTRQYDRVTFPGGEGFKSALHFSGGNHGQFNTAWGRFDTPRPLGWLINTRPLMAGEAQRQVARVYLGAFMETVLGDDQRYLPLFSNPLAGADWLPESFYLAEFQAAGDFPVSTFEEDIDLATATLAGASIRQENLTDWREQVVNLRLGLRETRAAYLGWMNNDDTTAKYSISLPETFTTSAAQALTFALADSGKTPTSRSDISADEDDNEEPAGTNAAEEGEESKLIDLTVRLTDAQGNAAALPLSHIAPLPPAMKPTLYKSSLLKDDVQAEPVFQTYRFALQDFVAANPAFEPGSIREIAFVFDRSSQGLVVLNNVGFSSQNMK